MLGGTKEPKDVSYFSFSRMGKEQGKWGIFGLNLEEVQEGIVSTRRKEKKTHVPVAPSVFVEMWKFVRQICAEDLRLLNHCLELGP